MKFEQLQVNWDKFGKVDPLWAILTNPEKRNNKWNVDEFFRTGEAEIDGVIQYINSLQLPRRRQKALDFGCGAGRLTQALCRYFDQCYGVDIAPSMIELAEKYNRYGSKCHYYTNSAQDLSLFEDNSFDFIYSI
jgi:2-polyprenyl-3-methyl-5-hydroxy-6-metoxy-1,4-benzoquinol methylase